MTDSRASKLPFLKRHFVAAGPLPTEKAVERRLIYPADDFELNCRLVSQFIATMNRPLSAGAILDFEEVWELMRYYDNYYPVRTVLSPNGRVLTTWHKDEYKGKRRADRALIIKVANLRQLELISSKIDYPHRYPSVDGPVIFYSQTRWRDVVYIPWFYDERGHVCRMHSTRFVERGDTLMTYEIYIIAPNVER